MKRTNKLFFPAILVSCLIGCGQEVDYQRPAGARDIVSSEILQRMEDAGHEIYEGLHPPSIQGRYRIRNGFLLIDERWEDHTDQWCDQTRDFLATDDPQVYESSNRLQGDCSGSSDGEMFYISGSNECFSLYARESEDFEGCQRDLIRVFSGCLNRQGIHNFSLAQLVVSQDGESCSELEEQRRINGVDYLRIFRTDLAVRLD